MHFVEMAWDAQGVSRNALLPGADYQVQVLLQVVLLEFRIVVVMSVLQAQAAHL